MNHYPDFNTAYVSLLQNIVENGAKVSPRPGSLGDTRELLAVSFSIPGDRPLCTLRNRKLSYAFAMIEPFYLFTHQYETDIASALMTYAPNLKKLAFNEATGKFDGNYGDRIHLNGFGNQMLRVYDVLKKDPQSRRAVVTIHNPVWDLVDSNSTDIPCTLNLQFMIRDGKMLCFTTMRSNDIWYGSPHNVMMFTFLQRAMAGWLGVEVGTYYHRANSLHIYEQHVGFALEVIRDNSLLDRENLVIYPHHKTPDETYKAAQGVINWEKQTRLAGSPAEFKGDPGYEFEVVSEISGWWRNRAKK